MPLTPDREPDHELDIGATNVTYKITDLLNGKGAKTVIAQPAYFEDIRKKASERWKQLENDPDLAAPWRQLFKQVQSPRHVVSELLQNADDAGATEAFVDLRNGEFLFEHNGEDFVEDHFASLLQVRLFQQAAFAHDRLSRGRIQEHFQPRRRGKAHDAHAFCSLQKPTLY